MARFPIDESTLPALGKALARAVEDETARQSFVADPKAYLVEAGVDETALAGMELVVSEDTDSKLHFVVPAMVDQTRVSSDPAYVEELGKSVTLGCAYMIERRIVEFPRVDVHAGIKTGTDS